MQTVAASPTPATTVLHVEDSDYFARSLKDELTSVRPELRIDRAATLVEALDLLEHHEYGCLLMDLTLSDASGLSGVRTVRERFSSIPIVALTSTEDADLAIQALESGVQDYLFKTAIDGPLLDRSIRYAIQRSEMEARLRQNERRFEGSFDQAPNGSAIVDLGGFILEANRALCEMLMCTEEELVGSVATQFAASESSPTLAAMLAQTLGNRAPTSRMTVRCITTSGATVWVDWSASIMHDENDEPLYAICHMIDITERKRNAAALTRSIENAARLEASNKELEEFASIAAHDLREPLRKVQALGDRLAAVAGGELGERGSDYLRRMQGASARMQDLVDSLLSFSRAAQAGSSQSVDLEELAESVVSDLEISIAESEGRVEIGNLPVVDGDASQLGQLLQNLISNALKFRRPEVPPRIVVSGEVLDGEALDAANQSAGPMCRLTVADNGIGFDERHLQKVFAVFGRLHSQSVYPGAGMGLALCRKIAQRHGGEITATSTPGDGSTFIATLPLKQGSTAATHSRAA